MEALAEIEDFIRQKVEIQNWTHKQVSDLLKKRSANMRGLSERSVRRFCACKGIHRTSRIDDQTLRERVTKAVSMVSYYTT